jgi:hypothetical protein
LIAHWGILAFTIAVRLLKADLRNGSTKAFLKGEDSLGRRDREGSLSERPNETGQ